MDEPTKNRVWELLGAGLDCPSVARSLGMNVDAVRALEAETGGVRPRSRRRSKRVLSFQEREEISRGLTEGATLTDIAEALGRAVSTISREVAHNGGRDKYRALRADRRAWQCARRPKAAKLTTCPRLNKEVSPPETCPSRGCLNAIRAGRPSRNSGISTVSPLSPKWPKRSIRG